MPQILCKDMTDGQRYDVNKYMGRWFGHVHVGEDVVTILHESSKAFHDKMLQGYLHESFHFYDPEKSFVKVVHTVKKKGAT